eukprot:217894-Rhodomonas_salina.2
MLSRTCNPIPAPAHSSPHSTKRRLLQLGWACPAVFRKSRSLLARRMLRCAFGERESAGAIGGCCAQNGRLDQGWELRRKFDL